MSDTQKNKKVWRAFRFPTSTAMLDSIDQVGNRFNPRVGDLVSHNGRVNWRITKAVRQNPSEVYVHLEKIRHEGVNE